MERQSGSDPVEGSRESVGEHDDQQRDAEPAFSHVGTGAVPQPTGGGGEDAGGITNLPLSEELREQDEVPDRGERKADRDA